MSGGHYPSYNHLQSPQEFLGPRHRLPTIPSTGPPASYTSASLSRAHAPNTSWMNKQSYPSNYLDNTGYYPHSASRNYTPVSRARFNEEPAGWTDQSEDSSARSVNQDKEYRICGNVFSSDVQQESMDLSSSSHVSAVPPTMTGPKLPPLNGEVVKEQINVNGAKSGDSDLEKLGSKLEAVSVIAPNPLKSACMTARNKNGGNTVKSDDDFAKSIVPSDNVESALETLFQSDGKSFTPTSVPSVIVSAQSCKKGDLRAESVEKILKSPSPEKLDELSPEAMLEELEKCEASEPKVVSKATNKLYSPSSVVSVDVISTQKTSSCDISKSEKKSNSSDPNQPGVNLSQPGRNTSLAEKLAQTEKAASTKSSELLNNFTKTDIDTRTCNIVNKKTNVQSKEQECSNTSKNVDTEVKVKSENESNSWPQLIPDSPSKAGLLKPGSKNTNKTDPKTCNDEITYVEVESELEKMFAGIEDSGSHDTDVDPLNTLPSDSAADPCHSSPHVTSNTRYCQSVMENLPTPKKPYKKKSSKKSKSNIPSLKSQSKTKSREISSADTITARRVPVIHVEGSKENPTSVQIMNSIKVEEDDLSDSKTAAKRKLGKHDRAAKRLAADYVLKNYDPGTSDSSWICVFCKLCPHNPGICGEPSGDLFGPYFIRDPSQLSAENDLQRYSRRTEHFEQVKKKQKRSLSSDSNVTDTPAVEQKSLEIWVHENCFVWASGVHLIGSKLMGFEEAVWEALETTCTHCGDKGASIGCRARHCKSVVHYGCAVFTGWSLDPETFITTCNVHTVLAEALMFNSGFTPWVLKELLVAEEHARQER